MSLTHVSECLEKAHGFPSLSSASVESSSLISSTWTQLVPQEEKEISWTRKCIYSGGSWVDVGSSSPNGESLVYSSPKFALLKMHLRALNDNRIRKSHELKDLHGEIYNSGGDTIVEHENLLAYIAEEKRPTNVPYFQKKKPSSEDATVGAEYDYIDTFGEQLEGKSRPCIVIFDSESKGDDPFKVLTSNDFNDEYYPIAVQFKSKDMLVGIAVPSNVPYRLGLRYCSNRPSFVFQIKRDGSQFSILHGLSGKTNSCAIRTTKNGNVYWFDRGMNETFYPGPHRTQVDLMGIIGDGEPEVVVKGSDAHFYHDSTPRHCDLDDHTLVLNTIADGMTLCPALVHVKEKRVEVLEKAKHVAVFDVRYGIIVGVQSSPLQPWSLVAAKEKEFIFETLIKHSGNVSEKIFKPLHLTAKTGNKLRFNSFYVGPSPKYDVEKIPLILIPHGGPHSVTVSSHSALLNYFVELGFGVLLINYRGSLGTGEESVLGLLGNVGRDDVDDCIQALQECLKSFPHLNDKEVFLFGGSHGGFLVTHLAGQYPDHFQGVVALNPVINIASMASATDIPDWCFNESGFPFDFGTPLTPEVAKVMWEKSPISHIKKVKAPIYLLIGKEDLRVPPAQGFEYYKALRGLRKEVKMNVFPDNHSLAKPPVCSNWMIKIGMFYLNKLKIK